MSEISVAIDIGTSRTKVAWRDTFGEVHFLNWDGTPYLPSVFHLPAASQDILLGEDALEAMEDEYNGYINNLKREIMEGRGVPLTHAERTETAEQLFAALFLQIREALLSQVAELDGLLPEQVVITVPGQASSAWRDVLQQAAQEAGFLSHQIMAEPIAAARGWLMEQDIDEATLVVLDCGGGTTDWSVVQCQRGRVTRPLDFKVESMALGGADVDLSLYQYVRSNHHSDSVTRYPAPKLINRLKAYKESALVGDSPKPIRLAGVQLNLDTDAVSQAYRSAFIEPLLDQCIPYLEKVTAQYNDASLLPVGGGQNPLLTVALKKAIPDLGMVNTKDAGLAVIFGSLALAQHQKKPQEQKIAEKPPQRSRSESWDTPDIHGWNTKQVQAWQQEVADKLGIAVVQQDRLKDGTQGPEMVLIPPGKYLMGSPPGEVGRDDSEGPQHQVTISQPFLLGQCALSFTHYDHYCELTGTKKPKDGAFLYGKWGRVDRPVINLSWEETKVYCLWLSQQTGLNYCLPTEAQWEYACRAGTMTPFWWGKQISTDQANYNGAFVYDKGPKGEYRGKTLPVVSFDANPWGLYQMHGNVWEWVLDGRNKSYHEAPNEDSAWESGDSKRRVLRGGSWGNFPWNLRSADHYRYTRGYRYDYIGFRLSRTL